MPRIEPIPFEEMTPEVRTHHRGRGGRGDVRHAGPAADLRLQDVADHDGQHGPSGLRQEHPARRPHHRAAAHPQRPARRVPALQPVEEARLHLGRGRRLPHRPRSRRRPDGAGAAGRGVPRPPLGRPPRHRRRDLSQAGRGLHVGADRRAGIRLCQRHGPAPLPAHAGPVRIGRAGHPLQRRSGRRGQARRRSRCKASA